MLSPILDIDPAAAFFGFMGCTSALVFACKKFLLYINEEKKMKRNWKEKKKKRKNLEKWKFLNSTYFILIFSFFFFFLFSSSTSFFSTFLIQMFWIFSSRFRSCLWDCKKWCWYFFYGCYETWISYEIYYSSSYGWSRWYLRFNYCCHYWNWRFFKKEHLKKNYVN